MLIDELAILATGPDCVTDLRMPGFAKKKKRRKNVQGSSVVAEISMGPAAALPACVLPEERDPVAVLDGAVEGVCEIQDGVVYQDLNVLRQVSARPVPENIP